MREKSIVLATAFVLSALGCSEEGPEPSICEERGMECAGDTICGEAECEPAFDRAYKVHVTAYRIGVGLPCAATPDCPLGPVTVSYNAEPVTQLIAQDAEIDVRSGSSLIVDFESEQCAVELTAERLRNGFVVCHGTDVGVTMALDPMPL